MQFNKDDDDYFIESLVQLGYIKPVGFDDEGEILYQATESFKSEFPEIFKEQIAETNNVMYELWCMGLVDITVKEEINDWIVMPNDKTFTCDLDTLTSQQKNLIKQLRYRSHNI